MSNKKEKNNKKIPKIEIKPNMPNNSVKSYIVLAIIAITIAYLVPVMYK